MAYVLLLVPSAGGVGARSQPTKDFASGDPNDSDDALFAPVLPKGSRRYMAGTFSTLLCIASTVDFFWMCRPKLAFFCLGMALTLLNMYFSAMFVVI